MALAPLRFCFTLLLVLTICAGLLRSQPTRQNESKASRFLGAPRLLDDPGGLRRNLEKRGLTFSLYLNHQYGALHLADTPVDRPRRHSGSVDLFVQADFEKMGFLNGGEALLQIKSNRGRNINPLLGAVSDPIDDSDFDVGIYIDQLWYQHSFAAGKLQLRLGYLDQQTALDRNRYANSEDKQFLSTLLDNNNVIVPLKIGLGASLFYHPTPWLSLTLATADADNQVLQSGFDTAFDDFKSLMFYFESGFKTAWATTWGRLPGNYRVGVFYHAREKPVFSGRGAEAPRRARGNAGFYLSFDQLLLPEADEVQGLGAFIRFGLQDGEVNPIRYSVSGGMSYRGPWPSRRLDTIGVGVYTLQSSREFRQAENPDFVRETGLEVYYRFQVLGWLTITPDFQFVMNPGALVSARDALVFVVRTRITL